MKPTPAHTCRRRDGKAIFPTVDCNYQSFSLDHYRGGSYGAPASFLNISRDYFRYEARWNFLAETAFFLVLAGILLATLIQGARVIIHFLHLPPA